MRFKSCPAIVLQVLGSPLLAASERPNIVLVLTDDQGWGDLGFHGNTVLRTPGLDRLAEESARVESFYVNPVCAPTRAAPRRWLGIGAFTGTLLIVVILTWLHSTGWTSSLTTKLKIAAIQRTAAVGLVVGDVLLEGRIHTPRQAILRAVSVRRGDPILGVNPSRIAQRVIAISWVENVIVERRLPGTLFVKIVERKPMALWQTTGRVALIDTGGVVLTRRDLKKFGRLVTVVGGDAVSYTHLTLPTKA